MVFHSQQIDDPFPTVDLRLADLPQKRQAIAAFMTEQFFSCQGGAFRRRVAEATARAWSLTLLTVLDREQMIGAVMLSEQPGTLGLYNLCVASAHRNRGWGQEIVRAVKKKAAMVAKPIILQCEPSLEAWYAKQGFKSSGYVDVFCLEQVP
jgi:ribosomal protein S18 acetylase RimI-like enzyme